MALPVRSAALLLTASLTTFSTTHTHRPPHASPHANSNSSRTHAQRLRTLACNHSLSASPSTCVCHMFTKLLPAHETYQTANETRGLACLHPLLLTMSPRLRELSYNLAALAHRPSENARRATTKPAGPVSYTHLTLPTIPLV